jgi:hypothetical protein
MQIIIVSAVIGAVLGLLAAHALFLAWWTLVPWGIAGVILGYFSKNKAVLAGIVYGFVLAFVFLIGQYTGDRPLLGRLPAFALLALFGAFCGLILTAIGYFVRAYRQR